MEWPIVLNCPGRVAVRALQIGSRLHLYSHSALHSTASSYWSPRWMGSH